MPTSGNNNNQRRDGLNPWAYLGVNAYQPPEFITQNRRPNSTDFQNISLGSIWLDISNYDTTPPRFHDIYILVNVINSVASWVKADTTDLLSLSGNTGGLIPPDAMNNISLVGDGTGITVAGNPLSNTLTVSLIADSYLSDLSGNSGGDVGPTAGNINLVGSGLITVVGNPGTSTLTIVPSGAIASSFDTDPPTGTATPSFGLLTFEGTNGVVCSASGSTITIDGSGTSSLDGFRADDGNVVTPTGDTISIVGVNNIKTTGTVGPNTLTIGLNGITQNRVQVGGASNTLTQIANGTTGQVLTATTGGNPTWQNISSSIIYATGTFVPGVTFNENAVGMTFAIQNGYYIRIQNTIFYTLFMKFTSKGSSTGIARFTGQPFASDVAPPYWDSQAITMGATNFITFDVGRTYGWINQNGASSVTTAITRQSVAGMNNILLTDNNFSDDSEVHVQGFYLIP
jgi:hypothetical protein